MLDNDALLKLCQYDLLDQALIVLGVEIHQVRVLNTARYSLLPKNNRLKRCKDETAARRLEAFIAVATTVDTNEPDADALDSLAGLQDIDAGEATLIAATIASPDALLITGDKRAIAALSNYSSLERFASRLDGRIYTLEAIIALLVKSDFSSTQHLVRQQPHVDKAITNIFGVSSANSSASVEEGLRSYIEHTRNNSGTLLADPFS